MIGHYFRCAFRQFGKNRLFSLINILGLAIGMSTFFLITRYVHYEKSYDSFHQNSDRIYRLRYERTTEDGQSVKFASCCPPAAPRIRESFPEVEKIGRIFHYRAIVSHQDKKFSEERIYFAETRFLDILKLKIIKGDTIKGLSEPGRAFISQTIARKYFGDREPLGQTLSVDKKTDYQIVGVFRDIPSNSHLKFNILLSFSNLESLLGREVMEAWGHTGFYTYLQLRPDTDPVEFEKKLAQLVSSEFGEVLKKYRMTMELKLQPLSDIHLTSHFMQEYEVNGNRDTIQYLFLIGVFVLSMAWINYTNLSTARSLSRAREVGLRKVIGASRFQLILQFLFETLLIYGLALGLTLAILEVIFPPFAQMTGLPPQAGLWGDPGWLMRVTVFFVAGIFISGIYPVYILSGFNPATVLKGSLIKRAGKLSPRKILVAFQFMLSLALITATLTVDRQISFMQKQNLGFSIDQILVVKAPRVRPEPYTEKYQTFRNTLLNNPRIEKVSYSTEVPGRQILWDAGAIHREGEDPNKGKNYQIVGVDENFIDLFGMRLLAGRNFSREYTSDLSHALILNETSVRLMGFSSIESSIGGRVDYWGEIFTVVGVLQDYHQQSPREAFEPHIFRYMPEGRGVRGMISMKIGPENIKETIAYIQKEYERFFPDNPFESFFMDDYFNQQYQADLLFRRVVGLFSLLAILITSLGLFALSVFNATRYTREIGIRKVMGANIRQIVMWLMSDVLVLLVIAQVLVLPFLVIGLTHWLEGYASRIILHPQLFIYALLFTASISILTITYQALKSARTNPVEVLRYE